MRLPQNAVVAVADGETLNLYRNTGHDRAPSLTALPGAEIATTNRSSGSRHQSSSANPSDSQQEEDSFAAGIASLLNKRVLDGEIDDLIVIAAPRTLGELRKHYHKSLEAKLTGEIAKDLTGHDATEILKAIASA